MRYGPNLLEEILRRTDIVQLVGRRVKLTRKGRVMWGCCPFHKEKSPSFKVENERRTYKCFGCGAGGDAFKWVMETEGLTFPEAVEELAAEAGVELPKWSPDDEAREEKKKSLYDVVEAACVFYEAQLRGPHGKEARDYLASRGLNDAAAKQFRLGYAPRENSLIEHLKTKNITLDDMIEAGLARPSDENRGARDFFFDRVMFPISDPRGRIIAFGARALSPDAKPKYINTGETTLFSKGHLLYNFATARPAALKSGTIILAEGYMDVIALVRAGFEASVAPLGTAFTEDQLALLWRTAPEPILAFDGDEAGLRAGKRAAELALPRLQPGHSLRFAFLPKGMDPDSLIRSEAGAAAMKAALDSAISLEELIWRIETEEQEFDTPERQAALITRLGQRADTVPIPNVRDFYLNAFAERATSRLGVNAYVSKGKIRIGFVRKSARRNAANVVSGPSLKEVSLPVKTSGLVVPMVAKPSRAIQPAESGRVQIRRPESPVPLHRRGAEGIGSPEAQKLMAKATRQRKELEVAILLLENPSLALTQSEVLAALPFTDRSLDRLRHELLNLAASGFRLEKGALENHLVRTGMADLVERLSARSGSVAAADAAGEVLGEDIETRWLRAAAQLREIAELGPERVRAVERFNSEPTEESWRDASRLLGLPRD